MGEVMEERPVDHMIVQELDLGTLPRGVYQVELITERGRGVRKVVKW